MESKLLSALSESFEKGFRDCDVVVGGFTYHMQSLNGMEAQWRDQFCPIAWSAAFLSAQKIPTLAVVIRSINGTSIAQLFPDEKVAKKTEQQELVEQAMTPASNGFDTLQFRAAKRFMDWLSTSIPESALDNLYMEYKNALATMEKDLTKEVLAADSRSFPEGAEPDQSAPVPKG